MINVEMLLDYLDQPLFLAVIGMLGICIASWALLTAWNKIVKPFVKSLVFQTKKIIQPTLCKIKLHDKIEEESGIGTGENHDSFRTNYKCSNSNCKWKEQYNKYRD